ncbi:MAG: N-acetylneuraminate synthase family protein, partial [Campylobacterota bacterium]|nr:N-acetylneuraminate synthase family protein [Campylobacterota bacterium]
TSAYPASLEEVNLKTISDMQSRFNLPIGLSDHTLGVNVPIASVALGACMIEKHFIADKAIGGPDASFSLEPAEFRQMVDAVRDVEKAMGQVNYTLSEKVKQNRVFSRSLFIAQEVQEGEIITEKNVRSVRPGYGLHPKHLEDILGKSFTCKAEKGTPLEWKHIHSQLS